MSTTPASSAGAGLVEVGDGKGDVPYRANMPYDLVKTAVVRMGEALAHEPSRTASRP